MSASMPPADAPMTTTRGFTNILPSRSSTARRLPEMPTQKAARKRSPNNKATTAEPASQPPPPVVDFPIAAVGASAGGLHAFLQFLDALPPSPVVSVVFVLHTDSRDSTSLRDGVTRKSKVSVEIAEAGARVGVNRVYVTTAGSYVI